MATFETDELLVKYKDTQKVRDAVFERVLAYFKEHESFSGECICQSDNTIIDAPQVLSDIADDILKFKVEYKD